MNWIAAIAVILTIIGGAYFVGEKAGELEGTFNQSITGMKSTLEASITGMENTFNVSIERLDDTVDRLENTTTKLTESVNSLNSSVAVLEETVATLRLNQKQVVSLSPDSIDQLATAIAKKNGN